MVSVGILNTSVWTVRFNGQTNILYPSFKKINFTRLQQQIKQFKHLTSFEIGQIVIEKHSDTHWNLKFPGVQLATTEWIVSPESPLQKFAIKMSESDLFELLEFAVHMQLQE
jgi:hypothetical protein